MITQTRCNIFKLNLLKGLENFDTGSIYTYKLALYDSIAILDADTVAYTTVGEITGTGYTAGGADLVPTIPVLSGTIALVSFANVLWNPATFTTRGALVYNGTTGAAVAVLNFGEDKTAVNTFTVTFPPVTATSSIIRIS
jgi:hypothetical protein